MSHAVDLSGKVILVTGASQGIGEQIARTFHHAGASVVLNSPGIDRTAEDAGRIAKELEQTRANSTLLVAWALLWQWGGIEVQAMNIPFIHLKTSRIYRSWIGWDGYGMGHLQPDARCTS